jgi:DNA modification methylase
MIGASEPLQVIEAKYASRFRIDESFSDTVTFAPNKHAPVHRWFSYPQGFSSKLVDDIFARFRVEAGTLVLDPFCGVGTTAVECKSRGVSSLNIDISPLAVFIARTKCTRFDLDAIEKAEKRLRTVDVSSAEFPESQYEFLQRAFSKERYNALLSLKAEIETIEDQATRDFCLLALLSILERASYIRKHGSHYRFINIDNPGVKHLGIKVDFDSIDVKSLFLEQLALMIADIQHTRYQGSKEDTMQFLVGDAREIDHLIDTPVDFVITSPPYLNRNNYIAQHKLELFFLDFVSNFKEYRDLTFRTFRSHVEAKGSPDVQDVDVPCLEPFLNQLDGRTMNNAKTMDMIKGYYADLDRFMHAIRNIVHEGTKLAFVLGNVRWAGVMIPTDCIFADIAEARGFSIEEILITRYKGNSPQQMKTYGRAPVRESIVILNGG